MNGNLLGLEAAAWQGRTTGADSEVERQPTARSGAGTKRTMKTFIAACRNWIESHPYAPLELVRIYLGVGLLIKGLFFLRNPEVLDTMLQAAVLPSLPISPAAYVIWAHIVGGALLAAGLLTRLAALAQMPIFYGAIAYAYVGRMTTLEARQGFEFAALMLFLCGLLVAFGGGPRSLDQIVFRRARKDSWTRAHPDAFLDLVRCFLGVALFLKGAFFMMHRDQLMELIESAGTWQIFPIALVHYVIPAHFAGGILLLIGVLTRWAALAQLPILFLAVFYLYLPTSFVIEGRQNLEFTALVLFLVLLVAAYGSGRWSVEQVSLRRLRAATATPQ
jgi:putative oxidoreductase